MSNQKNSERTLKKTPTDSIIDIIPDDRKCICGKRNDFTCLYDKCEDCCDEINCIKHGPLEGECNWCRENKEAICETCQLKMCLNCDKCYKYKISCQIDFCDKCMISRCPNEKYVGGFYCEKCFDIDKYLRMYYGACEVCDKALSMAMNDNHWKCHGCKRKFCEECSDKKDPSDQKEIDGDESAKQPIGPLSDEVTRESQCVGHNYIRYSCDIERCQRCRSGLGCFNHKIFSYCNKCYDAAVTNTDNIPPNVIRKFGMGGGSSSETEFVEIDRNGNIIENLEESCKTALQYIRDENYERLRKSYGFKIKKLKELRFAYGKVTECPICQGDIECEVECGHAFCLECCVKQGLAKTTSTCSLCRLKLGGVITVRK